MVRIERGIAYYVVAKNGGALDGNARAAIDAAIHDRMTEVVVDRLAEAERLFSHHAPQPLATIPVMTKGRSALEGANGAMGLALAPDEIDYLLENYSRIGAIRPTSS